MANGINQYNYNQPNVYRQPNKQNALNFKGTQAETAAAANVPFASAPALSVENAKEKVNETGVGNMAMGMPTTPAEMKKFVPYLLLGLAVSTAVTIGANMLCRGKLTETSLHKIGDAIDKSFLGNTPLTEAIGKNFEKYIKNPLKKLIPNGLPNAFINTPKPRNSMAKGTLSGILGQGVDTAMDALVYVADDVLQKQGYEKLLKASDALKAGTLTDKFAKFNEKGFSAELYNLADELGTKIIKVPKGKGGILNLWHGFGLFKTQKVELGLLVNKVKFVAGEDAKSFLGKTVQKIMLGMSESVGGGVLGSAGFGIAMNSIFLGQSFKAAGDAPKGEKVSTFMEDFWGNMVGGFLLMAPVGKMFYKTLGFNNISKVTSPVAKMALKPLEWTAKFFSMGVKPGSGWIKSTVGGAIRFMAIMYGLSKTTDVFKTASHKVFGTPTKTKLEEEEKLKNANVNQTPKNALIEEFFKNNKIANAQVDTKTVNAAPVKKPVAAKTLAPKQEERYIPSSAPAVFAADKVNNDAITKATQKSDAYLLNAEKLLKS